MEVLNPAPYFFEPTVYQFPDDGPYNLFRLPQGSDLGTDSLLELARSDPVGLFRSRLPMR
jgi:hypothetical protein